MSGTPDAPATRRRLWVTLGEAVAVLALVIAGLNYWDARREHARADRQAAAQVQAQTAFVMTGTANAAGSRVVFQPLNPAQAIQSQRYIFPRAVLDHAMEVSAARPQVDLAWISEGLERRLTAAHAPREGEDSVPVGVATTYVEAADTHTDQSIYRLGYAYRTGFLGGRRIVLQGLALERRGVRGDLQARVEARAAPQHHAS